MKRSWFLGMAMAVLLAGAGRDGMAQVRPLQPNIQAELHRAETAWRSGGSLLEAKVRADEVLRLSPDHPEALRLRAEVLLALKRYDEALPDAQRATELNPSDGQAYWILAESARLAGRPGVARESLRKAAGQITNENADLHIQLSQVAAQVDELDLAESFARVARARDPGYAAAHYQLARVFLLQGRQQAAISLLLSGLDDRVLDPRFIEQDSTLGVLARHPDLAPRLRER
ncbi:MAG: tetratricopeptide repeat protein [Rhodothermales bacterium]